MPRRLQQAGYEFRSPTLPEAFAAERVGSADNA
jgi:hypothetical protein